MKAGMLSACHISPATLSQPVSVLWQTGSKSGRRPAAVYNIPDFIAYDVCGPECAWSVQTSSCLLKKNVISRQNDPSPVFFSFNRPDLCVMLVFDGTAWLLDLGWILYSVFGYITCTCLDLMHLYVRASAGAADGSECAARPRFPFSKRGPKNEAKVPGSLRWLLGLYFSLFFCS